VAGDLFLRIRPAEGAEILCEGDGELSMQEWKIGSPPKYGTKNHYRANHSKAVVITMCNNAIDIAKHERFESTVFNELDADNGAFTGINRGEFGGSINFKKTDGEMYCLTNENCRGFFELCLNKYVLTGLAHMGSDKGKLYNIEQKNEKWQLEIMVDLKSCPQTVAIIDNKAYIITGKQIVVFNKDQTFEILVNDCLFQCLSPNSIVKNGDLLYIGMRGYVYVYNLTTKEEIWYDFLDYDKSLDKKEWLLKMGD
jgi:hypothetical protein